MVAGKGNRVKRAPFFFFILITKFFWRVVIAHGVAESDPTE